MTNLGDPAVRHNLFLRLSCIQPHTKPLWGLMSAHQMLCHLSDSFKAPIREKPVSPATGFLQRSIVKWVALYVPLPWPKGVPTRPEIDQGKGGTAPTDFERDLQNLRLVIARFTTSQPGFVWAPHPIFGEMSSSEWMRWGYLHMDHHLRQFGA